jgi:phosphate-selective porin OprO/OprP
VTAALLLGAASSYAQAGTKSLEERLEQLEQEIRILKRQKELDQEAAKEKAKTVPILQADAKGFGVKSADGNFAIRLNGQIKVDGNFLLDDDRKDFTDSFSSSSVRPILNGTVFKEFDFTLSGDFGGTGVSLTDAFLEWRHWPALKIKAGRFKQPFGLERLQSDVNNSFTTLGLPSQFVPARDIAIQVGGELYDGVFSYAASIGNGTVDGSSVLGDTSDGKELTGRIWVQPFKKTDIELVSGLGVGIAGSYGWQGGATNAANLASYKSSVGNTFFSYVTGSTNGTYAAGERVRFSPQFSYYYGRLGLLGEYVVSEQNVKRLARTDNLVNTSWQVAGSFLLTDDEASYKGVVPKKPFSLADGQWGAWELVGRYGELDVDNAAFTGSGGTQFADPAKSASKAGSWGVGLNWYLNKNVRAFFDYEHTFFNGGATGGNRASEDLLSTRFQLTF